MSRDLLIENPLWVHDRKQQRWLSPTFADIAAWLHAHPSEAVEIVRGLKVAGEWVDTLNGGSQKRYSVSGKDCGYEVVPVWKGANVTRSQSCMSMEPIGNYATPDAAKSAADAALKLAGWSLA